MSNRLGLGVIFALVSALSYAIQAAVVKSLGQQVPLVMLVFIQSLVSFGLISLVVTIKKKKIKTHYPGLQLLRTIFSMGISFFLFYAVTRIPLVDAVLLANAAPLLVPMLGLLFFSKKINHKLWLPIIIGLAGVILVLNPTKDIFNVAAFSALGAAFSMAMSMLLIRRMSDKDDSTITTFFYFLFSTIITGVISIFYWQALPWQAWVGMISIGVLFFIVQYAISSALKFAPPDIVSSLYYSNILFATLISVLVWHSPLKLYVIIGMLLIIGGGILTVQIQKRVQRHG